MTATDMTEGKRVFVPKVHGRRMSMLEIYSVSEIENFPRTKWGIPEPPAADRPTLEDSVLRDDNLIIVPALGFDSSGRRLGHGGGYYDRYLNTINLQRATAGKTNISTMGIALECQGFCDDIPTEDHDVCIDEVIYGRHQQKIDA